MANKFREIKEEKEQPKAAPAPEPEPQPEPQPEAVTDEAGESEPGKGGKVVKVVSRLLGGDVLTDKLVLKQIPLLLLCMVCFLVVVANRYNVENITREKQETEQRINYLREHRIQMQKRYQQSVKISHIAEDLKESGVGITAGPPYEI